MQPYSDMLRKVRTDRNRGMGESQERDSVVAVVSHESIPARDLEARWVAPRIVVNGVEISSLVVRPAVQILGHQLLICIDIRGRIANRDLPITSVPNILFHVPSGSFDIWSNIGVTSIVDDLVSREEGKSVWIIHKLINRCEDALEVDAIIGHFWIISVEGVLGIIGVEYKVNSSFLEGLHTLVMVGTVVDGVNSDGVDS